MAELVDDAVSQEGAPPADARADRGRGPVPPWATFLAGVVAAVVGLLPWLAGGARLPLQNLWDGGIPAEAPVVLLPFSQYHVTSIFALLVVGGAVAGVAARALVALAGGRGPALWMGGGLLVGQVVAVVQTIAAVAPGLRDGRDSSVYLVGIGGGMVACLLISAGVFALVALAPPAGALLGLTTGAVAVGVWLPIVVVETSGPGSAPMGLLRAFTYVMPVLVGAAIAWAGVRTVGRVFSALVSLVLVWLAPPLTTAISAALGTRILARDLPGMLEYGAGVFRLAATDTALVGETLALAVAVAVAGLILRESLGRRATPAEQPA